MCFKTKNVQRQIAAQDIECFKLLDGTKSSFYNYPYEVNIENPKEELKVEAGFISRGYHSFKEEYPFYKENQGKFIIPAGSEYYDDGKELVSSDIIFKGSLV